MGITNVQTANSLWLIISGHGNSISPLSGNNVCVGHDSYSEGSGHTVDLGQIALNRSSLDSRRASYTQKTNLLVNLH